MSHPKTFLFTDLENSTPLWEQYGAEMQPLMALHDQILTEAITSTNGQIVKSTGDGFHAVFDSAQDGITAALEGQKKLISQNGTNTKIPIKVRMGLHTGESEARAGDYFGPTVNRAARMMDIAHGGQILVSESTAVLAKGSLPEYVSLRDKGQHRLKGIATLEHVYQVTIQDLPKEFPPLRSLAAFKHNLPRQLTSFIGREKELIDVQRLLAETRLLTLLGPGGTGKTRLMLQTAEEVIDSYPDGVWLVELAPLTNPSKIPDRVAAALNVQEQPEREINDTVFDYLRQKELLLLLDNVEHLVRECAVFVEELLERCPDISVLVTGREALFISGETTLQIPSLSLPANSQSLTLDEVCRYEGIQLFLERAHAVRPDFEITEHNAARVAEIVQRLDGIPLALELAAARLRMMTVEQIAERLNDRFRLLTGGHRTALPRQQTLQALIDWSWNLLDEDEQFLLRRLSVFQGGWSLSVAQEVVGFEPLDEFTVFDLMEQLINKSVVNVEYPAEGKARYSLLESIRQYAQAKLFEVGEGELLRNRHADFYVRFAEEAEPQLAGAAMVEWLGKVTREMENLRAAMTWTLDQDPPLALRISVALLYRPNHPIQFSEGRSWLIAVEANNRQRFENGDPTVPA
jgi:predicted ATPase/class 3 adenylate cyclase